jgi:hypothetical protein
MKFYKKSVRRPSKYTGSIHKETPKKGNKSEHISISINLENYKNKNYCEQPFRHKET